MLGGEEIVTYPDGTIGAIPVHTSIEPYGHTDTYVTTNTGERIYYSENYNRLITDPLSTHSAAFKLRDVNQGFKAGYEVGFNNNTFAFITFNILHGIGGIGQANYYIGNFNAGVRAGRYDRKNQYSNWLDYRYYDVIKY